MRGEGYIVCQPDVFLLETSAGLQPSLEKFIITEDVVIEDVSEELHAYVLIDDSRRAEAARPTEADLPVGRAAPSPLRAEFEHPLGTGLITSELYSPTVTAEQLDILRIEAGIPKWGADMDENTIPNEAGLEARAISYDKGCYIGQETIARIKTYGHVNRHLVQLRLDGGAVPAHGTKILDGNKEVGAVTSAVQSTRFGAPVALGYVRCELAKPGVVVTVSGNQAEVIKLCGS